MPGDYNNGDMKHRNGAIVQHSKRKSEYRPAGNYHSGSKMSRNQSTGEQGRLNSLPSQGVDSSKMNPEEKLRYFNSLGLLNKSQQQQLADLDKAKEQPKAEPKQEPVKPAASTSNPVKELSDKLGKIFANKPQLIQGIVQKLQSVPKEQLKDKAQAILGAMQKNTSTEPTEVFQTIMRAMDDKPQAPKQEPQKAEPKRSAGGTMSPEEFHRDYDYLGKDFANELIKQASYFEDPEKALFHIALATDNADINDDDAVRSSMGSAADDLGSFFEPKGQDDDIDFDDDPEDDNLKQTQEMFNRIWSKYGITDFDSYRDFLKNSTPDQKGRFQDNIEQMQKSPKSKELYDYAMHKLNGFNSEEGEDSKFINIGDAIFSIVKDGLDVLGSSGENDAPKDVEPNADLPDSTSGIPKPESYDFQNDKEGFELAIDVYKYLHKHPELMKKAEPIFAKAWDNYDSLGYDRPAEAAFFEVFNFLQKNGINPYKAQPEDDSSMDAELSKDREIKGNLVNEYENLLNLVAEKGKLAGASKKEMNNNTLWIKNKINGNGRKLQKAWTDLVNGADDIDLDSPEAYEYIMNTLDNSFQDYENGNVTPWEKDIMSKYGK